MQMIILVTGCLAVWLAQDPSHKHWRLGSIFALIGQPFWVVTTFQAAQWGMVIVAVVSTLSWMKGFYIGWILPALEKRELAGNTSH